jgi:hypothetical protein
MLFDRLIYGYRCQEGDDDGSSGGGASNNGGGSASGGVSSSGAGTSDNGGDDSGAANALTNINNTTDPTDPAALISNEDVLKRGRELAIAGVPLQVGNLFDAINRLRAQAKGSTAEIFPQVLGQLSTIRGTLADASSAISRRLGYAGGGQTVRGRQVALGQAANQYGNLISQGQQSAFSNLIKNLGGLQPVLSGAARPPNTSVSTKPADFTNVGRSLAGFGSAYNAFAANLDANNAASTIAGFRNNPDIYNAAFGPPSVG